MSRFAKLVFVGMLFVEFIFCATADNANPQITAISAQILAIGLLIKEEK